MESMIALAATLGPFILMFGVLYLFMIRPQKKKDKAINNMRNAIEVGDHITTIGGVMGRVVAVRDDRITLETGADRNKLYFTKWAIQSKNDKAPQE